MQPSKFIKVDYQGNQHISSWFDINKNPKTVHHASRPRYLPSAIQQYRQVPSSAADKGAIQRIKKIYQEHTIIKNHQKLQTQQKTYFDSKDLDNKGFTIKKKVYTSSKKKRNQESEEEQRIFTSFSNRKRIFSQQRFKPNHQKHGLTLLNKQQLKSKISHAHIYKKRIINVIQILQDGLRWKLNQGFVGFSQSGNNSQNLKNFIKQIRNNLNYCYKSIYIFHLNRQPISNLADIHRKQYSIFVDKCGKLQLPFEIYINLNEQIKKIQKNIKQAQKDLGIEYDLGQKIQIDVQEYVDKMIENPNSHINMEKQQSKQLKSINDWYDKGLRQFSHTNNIKNQLKSKINQKLDLKPLQLSRIKLQKYKMIENPHKLKIHPTNLLLQNIKHQKQQGSELKNNLKQESWIQRNIKNISHSEKSIYSELIKKNSQLFRQNIPYIIQKYNISRSDAHNLYTLYKSLQQISAIRLKKKVDQILKNGIDRKTFDQGLNGLGINVGKQVINNIANFDDFINWPQFLKILSISASKTPEQKLNAILKYVNQDNQSQYLNKNQMDVLISASLAKFLGDTKQTGFSEMKEYFMTVLFEELDVQKQGKIKVQRLKKRILDKQHQTDLISFLFLANQP